MGSFDLQVNRWLSLLQYIMHLKLRVNSHEFYNRRSFGDNKTLNKIIYLLKCKPSPELLRQIGRIYILQNLWLVDASAASSSVIFLILNNYYSFWTTLLEWKTLPDVWTIVIRNKYNFEGIPVLNEGWHVWPHFVHP